MRFTSVNAGRLTTALGAFLLAYLCSIARPAAAAQLFDGATGWINSPALTNADLHGKIVLVDVWEYSCINCLRTLPYLREWYKRYAKDGFLIVGVHTPEFHFTGERENVAAAVKQLHVTWPVALDDNRTIWNRLHAEYWPEEYLFDRNGQLVDQTAGEGNYPQTESKIQALLKAGDPSLHLPPLMALLPQDSYDKPGAVCYPHTQETFVGPWRGTTPGDSASPWDKNDYSDMGKHTDGTIYLQGIWKASPNGQAMVSGSTNGYVAMPYHAIQVVSVLRPEDGRPVRVDVRQDGKPVPRQDAGKDLQYDSRGQSFVNVDQPRAYDIIMNHAFGNHELQLRPQATGLGVYSFAFESCEIPSGKP